MQTAAFFAACDAGDVEAVRRLVAGDPALVGADNPSAPHRGWTGLHAAAAGGHAAVVRVLLAHGADPNAREAGDNTSPLHWAAANRHVEAARELIDAGADVHGAGDVHELDVIGWATVFHPPGTSHGANSAPVVSLLVERGARHHIFSAIALGDVDLVRQVGRENPHALDRRMSRFEHGQTSLHFAINVQRPDIVSALVELGADPNAPDAHGQPPFAAAILRGDRASIDKLLAAGAAPPQTIDAAAFSARMAERGASVTRGVPMLFVPDVAEALNWYASIGFKELDRVGDDGLVNWGMVAFGEAVLMLNMHGTRGTQSAGLWFYTDNVDELYELLKARQVTEAYAALTGDTRSRNTIEFVQEIYTPPYGSREFTIRDLNGYMLTFLKTRG